MDKCGAVHPDGVICLREPNHASVVKPDGSGILHKGTYDDGCVLSWADAEHCATHGCNYSSSSRCFNCGSHRPPA